MSRATVLVLAAVPAAVSAQQSATAAASLIFDGVTVVDVEHGRLLPGQRVVIAGNRIQAVGGAGMVKMPEGVKVVDAHGKYLIPGLWDMHTHAGRSTDIIYPMFLANGVTGIRDAGSMVPLDTLILWRREILAGTRVGPPRQLLSGQSITNYSRECDRSQLQASFQTCVGDTADARHYVDSLKAAGADMIKPRDVYPEMYFVLAAEARRVGLRFGGHTWDDIDLAVSDSGASVIDHVRPFYDIMTGLRGRCWTGRPSASIEQCRPVVEQYRRNNTWVVPTLTAEHEVVQTERAQAIYDQSATRAGAFWQGEPLQGNWLQGATSAVSPQALLADTLGVLRVMERAGLPIAAGTDTGEPYMETVGPGFSIHTELAIYVAEGLTPLTALQSATLNPAKMLQGTDSLGTVAAGKLADLVLLDADPLADITNTTTIRAVVANGRYFDRVALDALFAEARAKAKAKAKAKTNEPP